MLGDIVMGGSIMVVIDIVLFLYICAGIINPSLWIQKQELKDNPEEKKKMRIIAIVLLCVEIVFCLLEYVF